MQHNFRGEAIYSAEQDVHFPQLTVGDTLGFAAEARAPRERPGGMTRHEYGQILRDVVMASLGISHTLNTKVRVPPPSLRGFLIYRCRWETNTFEVYQEAKGSVSQLQKPCCRVRHFKLGITRPAVSIRRMQSSSARISGALRISWGILLVWRSISRLKPPTMYVFTACA